MFEKLCDLIAGVPCVASTPTARKLIAEHLAENGVALLPVSGSRVKVTLKPGECIGTMSVEGEEFSVYVAEARAEQIGCIDVSTVKGPATTPSVIKRVFTIVEV